LQLALKSCLTWRVKYVIIICLYFIIRNISTKRKGNAPVSSSSSGITSDPDPSTSKRIRVESAEDEQSVGHPGSSAKPNLSEVQTAHRQVRSDARENYVPHDLRQRKESASVTVNPVKIPSLPSRAELCTTLEKMKCEHSSKDSNCLLDAFRHGEFNSPDFSRSVTLYERYAKLLLTKSSPEKSNAKIDVTMYEIFLKIICF